MTFSELWQSCHHTTPPLGWELRVAEHANWVRFHSLPNAKRYAETGREMSAILERQNAIAEQVIGGGKGCWLACCVMQVANSPEWQLPYMQLISDRQMVRQWEFLDSSDGDVSYDVYAVRTAWTSTAFDAELRDIAEDKLRAICWVSERTGSVFAPYDGGVDCIVSSIEAVRALKLQFSSLLSSRADGL